MSVYPVWHRMIYSCTHMIAVEYQRVKQRVGRDIAVAASTSNEHIFSPQGSRTNKETDRQTDSVQQIL